MSWNIFLIVLAPASYGVVNVFLERELKPQTPLLTATIMGCGAAATGFIGLVAAWALKKDVVNVGLVVSGGLVIAGLLALWATGRMGKDAVLTSSDLWLIALFCGIPFLLGDFACIAAYFNGASVAQVTIGLCLIPVFASLYKFLREGQGIPAGWELLGWALAVAAVAAVAMGQKTEIPMST